MRAINALRDANEALYLRVIEQGVASGAFRPMDPRLVVKPLLGALNWTSRWYQPRPGETAAERQAIAGEIAEFALAALSARPLPRAGSRAASLPLQEAATTR